MAKVKKIVSIVLVLTVLMSVLVLPVAAAESSTYATPVMKPCPSCGYVTYSTYLRELAYFCETLDQDPPNKLYILEWEYFCSLCQLRYYHFAGQEVRYS